VLERLFNVPLKELALLPVAPPVMLLVKLGAFQSYVVLSGNILPVGVILNSTPLQLVKLIGVSVAAGSTVTVIVKVVPVPDKDAGVTM
jgi:hypothetical protein